MARSVSVEGAREAQARLLGAGHRAGHQSAQMARMAAQTARQISGVPRDTGRLAGSIEPLEVTDQSFTVGSRVEYAWFVFHGTRYMAAQPPRVPPGIAQRTAEAIGQDLVRG